MPEIDTISGPPAKIRLADVGIVFRPRDREPVVAVRDFTFDVPEGSIVTIVGPSGCGKSTILNIVSGLMPPSRGKVEVDGRPVTGIRHDVGYMFARDGMMPWRTAIENVAFGLEVRGVPKRQAEERARFYVALVGLAEFADAFPNQLSGGMAQRVGIARALTVQPEILLLDEPLGALDAMTKIGMQEELARIWSEENVTMVMVTHDLEEAIYLADRVLILPKEKGGAARLIDIDLPRPRERSETRFVRYREELLREFGLH